MTEAYISLPLSMFNELPRETREFILGRSETLPKDLGSAEEGPVEMTTAQVRKLVSGLGDKTTALLRAVSRSATPTFRLRDLIAATPDAEHNGDLRGVFSAITRRTRRVCGDDEVDLFWWKEDHVYNEEMELIDITGYTSALTHASLKAILDS